MESKLRGLAMVLREVTIILLAGLEDFLETSHDMSALYKRRTKRKEGG